MDEIIQSLKTNATNGKESFCYISERQLLAMKEISKKEEQERNNLKQTLNEIKEYCNNEREDCQINQVHNEYSCCIDKLNDILQKIDKALGE